ncbi:MAG: PASTA domain-containing protein [Actinomycetes bacterium]|jgi:beta-lactam-binding protein with PASTA domain|nr:PASTA domain-containing protein [Actinomycetes bacterium]
MPWWKRTKQTESVTETEVAPPKESTATETSAILSVEESRAGNSVQSDTVDDDAVISDVLSGLRADLQSQLPDADEFLAGGDTTGAADGENPSEHTNTFMGLDVSVAKRRRTYLTLVIVGLVTLLLMVGGVWAWLTYGQITVPDLVGQPSTEAIKVLNEVGLKVGAMNETEVAGVEPGIVVNQDPIVDKKVRRGSAVDLTVSMAADNVLVPDVTGKTREAARETLSAERLSVEEIPTFSNTVQTGSVVGFLPTAGTEVPGGSTVSLLVAKGAADATVEMPKVLGLTAEAAETVLREAGFNPHIYYASTSFGNLDEVVAQTPSSKTAATSGAVVLVLVSRGNSTTELTVPELVGKPRAEAETSVSAAGFAAEIFEIVDSSVATGTVVAQTPPSKDSLLKAGDSLGLLVSRGADTAVTVPNLLSQDSSTAAVALQAVGLVARIVPLPVGLQPGLVAQQFPADGTAYRLGLPVLLYTEGTR